jgi:hypothetical protein
MRMLKEGGFQLILIPFIGRIGGPHNGLGPLPEQDSDSASFAAESNAQGRKRPMIRICTVDLLHGRIQVGCQRKMTETRKKVSMNPIAT